MSKNMGSRKTKQAPWKIPITRAQRKRDFFRSEDTASRSSLPASRDTTRVTAEARDRERQSSTSRGCRKMLTAATEKLPSAPTRIRSVEARRIMKSPSSAAGNAIFRYCLS